MQLRRLLWAWISFVTASASAAEPPDLPKPTSRTERNIEDWTVRVDDRLLQPPNLALGTRALKLLEAKLTEITTVVAPDRLAKLKAVVIILDQTHGKLDCMQYHPEADWLVENGYSKDLAKCVHLANVYDFLNPRVNNEQPWVVLHELAHAYHDQVLTFDDVHILDAFEHYKKSRHGESIMFIDGTKVKHYALTDHKEFFAEMTESYIGRNDFFPFNRAELKTAEPEIFELMRKAWGPVAEHRHPTGENAAD